MSNEALVAALRDAAFQAEMKGVNTVRLTLGIPGAYTLANILEEANTPSTPSSCGKLPSDAEHPSHD